MLRRLSALLLVSVPVLLGCAEPRLVPLARPPDFPLPSSADRTPLEVVTRATGVSDPLRVAGAQVAYQQVDAAVGWAVLAAAAPWADAHPAKPGEGYQLTVELTRAEAKHDGERLTVALGCRATLRNRLGNRYVAQTNARCDTAGLVRADDGVAVFGACTRQIARTLASWLDGLSASGAAPLIPRAPDGARDDGPRRSATKNAESWRERS